MMLGEITVLQVKPNSAGRWLCQHKNEDNMILDVLHALMTAKNTSWACPCLSVCLLCFQQSWITLVQK